MEVDGMRMCRINPDYAHDLQLRRYIDALPQSFYADGTLIWNRRNKIRFYADAVADDKAGSAMVVKRFKKLNVMQKIIYACLKGKARKAFDNGMELRRRGVPTPEPMACVELRRGPFIMDAYYISRSTSFMPIEDCLDCDDWDASVASAFAEFVANLHNKGVLHGDLNDTNVRYMRDAQGKISFEVIDINRMRLLPMGSEPSMHQCIENLTRFTGRISLFEYVIRHYAETRQLDVEAWARMGVMQKQKHDLNWRRRKKILHCFKRKKKNK